MTYIPLTICLITLLNAIYRHDLSSSLMFLSALAFYALQEYKINAKQIQDIVDSAAQHRKEFREELEKKWIAFDHNFQEINKKLVEHDNIITKGAIGLMSGLKKVQK